MYRVEMCRVLLLLYLILIGLFPLAALAQGSAMGPQAGDRELTLSGTGRSKNSLDAATFGVTGGLGWFYTDPLELGLRQSVNYADVPHNSDNLLNGSSRGFPDYHFVATEPARPFPGASLGATYGPL